MRSPAGDASGVRCSSATSGGAGTSRLAPDACGASAVATTGIDASATRAVTGTVTAPVGAVSTTEPVKACPVGENVTTTSASSTSADSGGSAWTDTSRASGTPPSATVRCTSTDASAEEQARLLQVFLRHVDGTEAPA